MAESEKSIPLAISLPETLIEELDRVAANVKESRSAVMRKAIREGLPILKAGGNADVLALDSELSTDVDQTVKETKERRNKILLEAIRIGLQPYFTRKTSEMVSLADKKDPKEKDYLLQQIERSYELYTDPMVIEQRKLIVERGRAVTRLNDILQHVPEAKRRDDLVTRLTEFRHKPGGSGGGAVWGCGLSNEEVEWQVAMYEKYGVPSSNWPKEETDAREAARKVEHQK